jgi:hypothetical protein
MEVGILYEDYELLSVIIQLCSKAMYVELTFLAAR